MINKTIQIKEKENKILKTDKAKFLAKIKNEFSDVFDVNKK